MAFQKLGCCNILGPYSGRVTVSVPREGGRDRGIGRGSGQLNRLEERWNDVRTRCNFLGAPPRESQPLDGNSRKLWMHFYTLMHKYTHTEPDLCFVVLRIYLFIYLFYKGSNWLQQQPRMLLGRNGANKTNLIANKLHGEFKLYILLQALSGGKIYI